MFSKAFVTVFALALFSCVNSRPLPAKPGRSLLDHTLTHWKCIHIRALEWIKCNEAYETSLHHRIVVGEEVADDNSAVSRTTVNVFAETVEEAVDEAGLIFSLSDDQRVSVESLIRPGIGGTLLKRDVVDAPEDVVAANDGAACGCSCKHFCLNPENTCDCCDCHKILNSWTANEHHWTKMGTVCWKTPVSTFAQVDGSFTIYHKHHREEVDCTEAVSHHTSPSEH